MAIRVTTESFVERARKVHGTRYDYSRVRYERNSKPVEIICPDHGPFFQRPDNHTAKKRPTGCPICGNARISQTQSKSRDQFVAEAVKIHGEGTYDYSRVNYVNGRTKVEIICPKHGPFLQMPNGHLQGKTCLKCSYELRAKGSRKSGTEFVADAIKVHGKDTYDYSKTNYVNSQTDIEITCPKHGPFWQTPGNHLGGFGCPECGRKRIAESRRSSREQFIEKSEAMHGKGVYDYSKVHYVEARQKVEIICPTHGSFWQTPGSHNDPRGPQGCPHCGAQRTADSTRLSKEDFIAQAEAIHGKGIYDYSRVDYINARTKVEIICRKHKTSFWQTPDSHTSSRHAQGCPACAESGFDQSKPAILYYVRIETATRPLYKIGITNRTVEERFFAEGVDIKTIATWDYPFGIEALERETEVIRAFRDHLYDGDPILRNTGTAEIFEFDVLGLDD